MAIGYVTFMGHSIELEYQYDPLIEETQVQPSEGGEYEIETMKIENIDLTDLLSIYENEIILEFINQNK